MAIHSPQGKLQLAPFHIGTLVTAATSAAAASTAAAEPISPTFLNKKKWKKTKLISIEKISHDSRIFRFALEAPDQKLGLVRPSLPVPYLVLRRRS